MLFRPLLLGLVACTLGQPAWAQDSERALRLAALRAEVEALQHDVTMEKQAMARRLLAIDTSRTELEVQIRQEELQLQQLELELDKERAAALTEGAATEALTPAVLAGIAAIRPVVATGMPYRVPERLAALDELETALTGGTLPPHKAASRLWQRIEDELRLGRENGVDRQIIDLDGEEILVDVARLGMVALFFRTADGSVGWVEPTDGGWTWVRTDDRGDRARIAELFDNLEKQIRVGWFEVPNTLPEVR